MCGINGVVSLGGVPIPDAARRIAVMNEIIAHRGPDGEGVWVSPSGMAALGHRRLAIIDLSENASQPMVSDSGKAIAFNGEIYNYQQIRDGYLVGKGVQMRSDSDTEVILKHHDVNGHETPSSLRGMFAYAVWDERERELFLARDRFGIKPLYYAVVGDLFYFASEAKALLPFLPSVEIDEVALGDYLTFQYTVGEETLFAGIKQLLPGHSLVVRNGSISVHRYWSLQYEPEYSQSESYFIDGVRARAEDSIRAHLVSDVEVGAYVSGGLDSSIVAAMGSRISGNPLRLFHGRFDKKGFDESEYAISVAEDLGSELNLVDMSSDDFERDIRDVIYHLDYPVGGPGSLPQYAVSRASAQKLKVILGGQGGDEIFGGYARYMVGYLEQALKAAIEGTSKDGNYVVTLENLAPQLSLLNSYKPLIKDFWSDGLFGPADERFLALINRSRDLKSVLNPDVDFAAPRERFFGIFNDADAVRSGSYFDKMTNFELRTLLPALLQVEDRMSMAHGLESRVPFLDHELVEFVATAPANVKFGGGQLKHLLVASLGREIPHNVAHRKDKMGFPVPINDWAQGSQREFIGDLLNSSAAKARPYLADSVDLSQALNSNAYSRGLWALVSLELWNQLFVDESASWKSKFENSQGR